MDPITRGIWLVLGLGIALMAVVELDRIADREPVVIVQIVCNDADRCTIEEGPP